MSESLQPPLEPAEAAKAQFLKDSLELMRGATFRRWVWHLIEDRGWCAAHGRMKQNQGDPLMASDEMLFALGKREIGALLEATLMGVGDALFKTMFLEAVNLKTQREMQYQQQLRDERTGK